MRFRSFETKRRWSLDAKRVVGGELEQAKMTRPGLMAPAACFSDEPNPYRMTVFVEGETDMLAGISMIMEDHGEDPADWPARIFGLPGVGAGHDLLTRELIGATAVFFLDPDRAGRQAVFDHRRTVLACKCGDLRGQKFSENVCEQCATAVIQRLDMESPRIPGLITKMRERNIKALAAFPPTEGSKVDLRDLRRLGWRWHQVEERIEQTATSDGAALGWAARHG